VALSARTRVAGIIGDPVAHSRSPAMHNAAFAALDLDWVYVAFTVRRGRGAAAITAARELGLAGLSVTMPHKGDAAAVCDELTPVAGVLGAINTVVGRGDGSLLGDSTDGEGFLRALTDEGVDAAGRACLVVGAGGAARAVAYALGRAGAAVTVSARREDAAAGAAALAGGSAVKLGGERVEDFEVIVNATPIGMRGEPAPIDVSGLRPGQFVYDTVYPVDTPLLAAARARGAACAGGLGMLVHQGALAFRLWTGEDAPLDVMRTAAERG
jgi:shikimate dehydrogenase